MNATRYAANSNGEVLEHPFGNLVLVQDYNKLKEAYDKLKAKVDEKVLHPDEQRFVIRYEKECDLHFTHVFDGTRVKQNLEEVINDFKGTDPELFQVIEYKFETAPSTVKVLSFGKA